MKTTLIALAASLTALTPIAAMAQQSVTVEHRDLNLGTPEGQAALDRRVDAAARKVCSLDTVRTGTRIRSAENFECYRQAKAQVKKQVAAALAAQQLGG